jgi:hypothetical protein
MKKRDSLLLGVASVALVAFVVYASKKMNTQRKLRKASDEGYETAHDILYPSKTIAAKKLRFGPILPE